ELKQVRSSFLQIIPLQAIWEGTTRSTRGVRIFLLSCASCASCGSFPDFFTTRSQKLVPPKSVLPSTESQCFPAAGALPVGHFAIAPVRDPKLLPSRRGLSFTLKIVPCGKLVAVIPC